MEHGDRFDPARQPNINAASSTYLDRLELQEDYQEYAAFAHTYQGGYNFSAWLAEQLGGGTCQDLAEALHISKGTVSKWWNGTALPTRENFVLLLLYFSTPLPDAQRALTRLGHYCALYAKDPADAAAILLLHVSQLEKIPVRRLLGTDPQTCLRSRFEALTDQCRRWTEHGAPTADDPAAPPPTDVLLEDLLLDETALLQVRGSWQTHLCSYCCNKLFVYHRSQLERMNRYLARWTADMPDFLSCQTDRSVPAYLFNPAIQWDAERIRHQISNLPKRRTIPGRDDVILWGLKLGMPSYNIDELLCQSGYAPLGIADTDSTRARYGTAGGLEGALKLALKALLTAFPSLFAGWPSATEQIREHFPAYDAALQKEAAFRQFMADQHLLTRDLLPCYRIGEADLKFIHWSSINGDDLSLKNDSLFRRQASVYQMLFGPYNKDGSKTFVRHIIQGMRLPYEELPVWLAAPTE